MLTILAALGLPETATEADAAAHATKLVALMRTTGADSPEAAAGTVSAWKNSHERLAATVAELAAVQAEKVRAEITTLVDAAIVDAKITPGQRQMMIDQGIAQPEFLRSFLATASPIAPVAKPAKQPAEPPAGGLTEAEARVAKLTGNNTAELAKHKAREDKLPHAGT